MSENYAAAGDVTNVLGPIGNRLPSWLDVEEFLTLGHAVTIDALAQVYPDKIPTFEGDALTLVKLVEAKLTAAEILDAVRVLLKDENDLTAAESFRASAYASIANGVVGYRPGTEAVDDDGDPLTPDVTNVAPGPRISSFTPMSAFPDPYDAIRSRTDAETSY